MYIMNSPAPGRPPRRAELPECRLQIASNETILHQLVAVMLTPTYKYIASLVTVAGLLCLAYSPETHQYLARPFVIDGIIEACEINRTWCHLSEEEQKLDSLLLRWVYIIYHHNNYYC